MGLLTLLVGRRGGTIWGEAIHIDVDANFRRRLAGWAFRLWGIWPRAAP
jgi:hypothetical protein